MVDQTGPRLASRPGMNAAMTFCLFALDRVRTVLVALSLIVLLKTAWILLTPAG
jgi:hypothetical protein